MFNLGNFYLIACVYDEGVGYYSNSYHYNGDPFYSDCADYKVTITADKDYVVAGSGKVVWAAENGEKASKTFAIKNARSVAFVLSEKFESITDNSTGVQINYYYYFY